MTQPTSNIEELYIEEIRNPETFAHLGGLIRISEHADDHTTPTTPTDVFIELEQQVTTHTTITELHYKRAQTWERATNGRDCLTYENHYHLTDAKQYTYTEEITP